MQKRKDTERNADDPEKGAEEEGDKGELGWGPISRIGGPPGKPEALQPGEAVEFKVALFTNVDTEGESDIQVHLDDSLLVRLRTQTGNDDPFRTALTANPANGAPVNGIAL